MGAAVLLMAPVLIALVYVIPRAHRNPLAETAVWSLLVMVSFAGWGSLVRWLVARDEQLDLGLRVAWGAGVVCFLGGALMTLSLMKRATTFAIVEAGLALALASMWIERARLVRAFQFSARVARREPRLAFMVAVVLGLVALQYCGGIAEWHTNPYDDDIAYLAFVKKMLDTGTLIEPFSFRRLSALGGQSLFIELVSVRAVPSQGHTFDRSICLLMVVLLLWGFRTGRRRAPILAFILGTTFFLTLPSIAINTASYYSGVAFFLALFRTVMWLGQRPAWKNALPLAFVAAAVCTLRQNYLPVPAFTIAAVYARTILVRKSEIKLGARLVEPLWVAALSIAFLAPWMVVAYQSNLTFLYPVMNGTFNRELALQASGMTLIRECYMQVWTAIEGLPLQTLGLFVIGAALVRETNPKRPLWAAAIGSFVGFVSLVHGLTQSDAGNIGRYAYGFGTAFVLLTFFVLTSRVSAVYSRVTRNHLAAGLVIIAVCIQFFDSKRTLNVTYTRMFRNVEQLAHQTPRASRVEAPEVDLYFRLQHVVPEGARVAVLLDEPHYLDFERNPIWNLDMPGYSSLPPGMPFFQGSARLKEYFAKIGVRYLAFVRPEYSRYHYRREYWVEMLTDEQEIWRLFAPYLLDFLDSMTDLARHSKHMFDERGLVLLDLAEGT